MILKEVLINHVVPKEFKDIKSHQITSNDIKRPQEIKYIKPV